MATVNDQINAALRLIGELAEGETPSAETSADCLAAFNQMLDSWSTERLAIYYLRTDTFTWPASTRTRTMGPSGDFVATRPISIDPSTYFRDTNTGVSYPLMIVNKDQYNGIALKTVTSTYPQVMFVEMANPDITFYFYPVPTISLEFNVVSPSPLAQATSLATALAFPPGYLRAFKYCLACEIAQEFGKEPPPQVQKIAAKSLRNIKRINNPGDLMAMPYPIVATRGRFNIYTNQPS